MDMQKQITGRPNSDELQEIVLRMMSKIVGSRKVITKLDELEDNPIDGTLITGEQVRMLLSIWTVFERAPKFSNLSEAQAACAKAIEASFSIIGREIWDKVKVYLGSELVTDIRYETEDGEFRIRLYSQLTNKQYIDIGATDIQREVIESLRQEEVKLEKGIQMVGGILVSIQKLSSEDDSIEDGSRDTTRTFLTINIGANHPEISLEGLEDIIIKLTKSITTEAKSVPTKILSKVRTGIHFRVEEESVARDREKELVYVAYDTRRVNNRVEEHVGMEGEVHLFRVVRDRQINEPKTVEIDGGEIEVNSEFHLFERNKPDRDKRASIVITAFLPKNDKNQLVDE